MQIDLSGHSALVTGGSRGLGRAIAMRFARSGADVAILARDAASLDEAAGAIRAAAPSVRVIAKVCDLTRPADTEAAAADVIADLGRLDILVNNAGTSFRKPFDDLSRDDLVADLDLKLFPALRLAQLVVPGMKERRFGRIINVLSINAKAPRGGSAPTTVSRAAGLALTKVLAHELAPHNILVNALCGATGSRRRSCPTRRFSRTRRRRCRSAASARPRSSRTSPASSPRMPPPTSPARRSTSTAACRPSPETNPMKVATHRLPVSFRSCPPPV